MFGVRSLKEILSERLKMIKRDLDRQNLGKLNKTKAMKVFLVISAFIFYSSFKVVHAVVVAANLAAAVAAANLAVAVAVHQMVSKTYKNDIGCCGGRRKRALISAAARGALGNAALMPRVNEPTQSRVGRCASCEGQQGCGGGSCQDCKMDAGKGPVSGQQQCRKCTPEEEKECMKKMASTTAQSVKGTSGLSRLFKHAMHKQSSDKSANNCPPANGQQCKC
ncbi:hypothetical protein M3Y97_01060500 [Aphelenchoides bicaudatus]|nr:hypothetical protein M3Y97_01060500 [Aphelenchoides bicaudatus]